MSIWGYYVCFSVIMSKVYVGSKRECPSDVVLRRSESGALYYLPEERGMGAEVGGVMDTFDELFGDLSKDDPLDDVIQFVADNIIPESLVTEDFKSKVRDRIRHNLNATGEVESSMIKGLVFKTGLAEKNRLSRVYVGDPDEVPEGYIPMEDEDGGVYYERIDSQFIDSGRTSKDVDNKSRIYVSSPNEVPDGYTPQQGPGGGVYYDTDEGPSSIAGGFSDSINEMVEDLVRLVTGDQTPHMDDPTREDLEAAAENLRARQGELMMSDDFVSTLDQLLKGSSVTPEEFFEEIGSLGKRT